MAWLKPLETNVRRNLRHPTPKPQSPIVQIRVQFAITPLWNHLDPVFGAQPNADHSGVVCGEREVSPLRSGRRRGWRGRMGVEPTGAGITAARTVLKTGRTTGFHPPPCRSVGYAQSRTRSTVRPRRRAICMHSNTSQERYESISS